MVWGWHFLRLILTWYVRGTESPKPVINEAGRIPMSKSLHADFVIRYRMYLGAYRDMLFLLEWVVRLRRPAPNQLMEKNLSGLCKQAKLNKLIC
jgi:hypothetical protein